MRGSARWISQLALRPTRTQSALTVFFDCVIRPSGRGALLDDEKLHAAASPVDEHRDDVHDERGEQHEGERHVDVEPELEDRLVAKVAPRAPEQLVLLQQQAVDLLARAARLRPGDDSRPAATRAPRAPWGIADRVPEMSLRKPPPSRVPFTERSTSAKSPSGSDSAFSRISRSRSAMRSTIASSVSSPRFAVITRGTRMYAKTP